MMNGRLWLRGLPLAVAAVLAGLTLWAWRDGENSRSEVSRLAFQREALRLETAINDRLEHYEAVVRAGQGLIDGTADVTQDGWLRFVDAIGLSDRYPGLEAVVFYDYASAATLPALVERRRASWGRDFSVWLPPGFEARDEHLVAGLVAPRSSIAAIRGLDFAGERHRWGIAVQARDSGRTMMTPMLRLVTPGATGSDAVVVAPVYAGGGVPSTLEQRRSSFRGLVAAGYNLEKIVHQAFHLAPPDLHLDVYDVSPGMAAAEASSGDGPLIYHHGSQVPVARFDHVGTLRPAQRTWRLEIRAGERFLEHLAGTQAPSLLLVGGLVTSALIGVVAWLLVSRRQQAQDLAARMTSALQDSEERYRQLFVGSRAVELLIDPEDGGRIVDANAAAARFYGLTVEDLRRMRISDINILSDEEVKAEMAHAAAQRRDHFLFRHRLANGDVRDVEVHSGPLPLGPRRLLYSIIHDVTERRQAEIALAVSEARFRALFEDSPLAIQVVDPDGRTMRVNRAWQSLWMRDPAKDPGPMDDPQLVRTRVVASLRAAYDGSTVEIPPFRYVLPTAPDNPVRWIRAYAYPIRDPGGQGNQLIIVWEDVSEKLGQEERLKETLSELERSNNDLEQFAYVASHDLQEPLRMISSYIGLLQRRYGGDLAPEALEFMGYAVDGAHRMQNIINDLLTYSRVGRKGRPFTWCALAEMVKVACDSLAVAIEDAQAEVTVDGTLPVVLGDAHELGRLFQNLIGNAVKYARPETPPRIRIACAAVDGAWRVTVDDNGIGVAAEFRDRIFQIFQRLHSRSEYGGTGVGLAICKKIVERHGGRIGVEDGPGGGSRFWFTLAMAPAEEEGGSAAETPPLSWADPARP